VTGWYECAHVTVVLAWTTLDRSIRKVGTPASVFA
jgi:hypothetical protein